MFSNKTTEFRKSLKSKQWLLLSPLLIWDPVVADEEILENIIVEATRIEGQINDAPVSISVIDKEQITELMPNSLSDLLRYQPGVSVERSSDRYGDANINVRGIGGNRVLILKDGILMPEGFGSAGVSQSRGNFDPFGLKQVEILKGPASALYGSNALGGVVSMRTPDPIDLVELNNGSPYVNVNSGYFSEDDRYRVGVAAATKLQDSYLSLQLQQQTFEEREINSSFDPNPKDGDSQIATIKWQNRLSENNSITILADHFKEETENNLLTNLGPISGPPGTAVTASEVADDSSVWRVGVQQELESLGWFDRVQWQVNYQYSNYEQFEQERQQNPGSAIPPIPAQDVLELEWEEFEQHQAGAGLLLEKETNAHHALFGFEVVQRSIERPVDRLSNDLINQTSTDVIDGISHPGKTFPDADVLQYGIFVQDHFRVADSVKLVAGIRFDYFENDPQVDQAYENFNVSNAEPEKYSDDAVSPHLGLLWDLSDSATLFANYASGFRSPPVAEQYISRAILIPVPGVPHEVIPNNELSSESSDGIELGVRWSFDNFSASLSAYRNEYTDFIDTSTVGFREIPPVFVFANGTAVRQIQYLNVDEVVIEGLELSARLQLDNWLPGAWSGNLNFAASVIDGENKTTGNGLNSVPPDNVVLGITLSPSQQWQFGWHVRASGPADDAEPLSQQGVTLPAFEPPGYSVHDLSLRWLPTQQFALALSIYNAGDKKYWSSHAKGSNANGNLDASVEPGQTFALSAQYQF